MHTEIFISHHEFPWGKQAISPSVKSDSSSALQAFLCEAPDFLLLSHSTVVSSHNMYCAYLVPSIYCNIHTRIIFLVCVAVKTKCKLLTLQTFLSVISHCNTCKKKNKYTVFEHCFMFNWICFGLHIGKAQTSYWLNILQMLNRNNS